MSPLSIALLLVLSAIASNANPAPLLAPVSTPPVSVYLEPAAASSAAFPLAHAPNSTSSLGTTPTLYTCSSANCASGCLETDLTNIGGSGNCYRTFPFSSVRLNDPSNVFLPGFVDVAPRNCMGWLQIPRQGVCYNIQGGPFTQYGAHEV